MNTPPKYSSSWEPTSLAPDVDDRSTAARPSPMKRLARRMGLSTSNGQDLSHLQGSHHSHSSGSLTRSFASTSAPTEDSRESGRSVLSRLRRPKEELPDVADMLEDDNLAWGATPSKSRRRKNGSPARSEEY
ncbi:hypothetical protein BV20DRAFT_1049350 [Pilatotrama ljubarskyi]|nr:hypothetical protein BV20DRAFT_1049350 [Pilatotrama ljubarskyi]